MHNFYTKEYVTQNEWFWKQLCTVNNNESLGLMERFLQQLQVEYKIEKVEPPAWVKEIKPKFKFSEE